MFLERMQIVSDLRKSANLIRAKKLGLWRWIKERLLTLVCPRLKHWTSRVPQLSELGHLDFLLELWLIIIHPEKSHLDQRYFLTDQIITSASFSNSSSNSYFELNTQTLLDPRHNTISLSADQMLLAHEVGSVGGHGQRGWFLSGWAGCVYCN